MDVKIFGPGCAKCSEVEKMVKDLIAEQGASNINVEKISDLKAMMQAGILSTPAMTIDGKAVCTGRVPSKDEVKGWLGL